MTQQLPPMPQPPASRPPAHVPDNIEGARQAWLATCGVQVLYFLTIAAGMWLSPMEMMKQFTADGADAGGAGGAVVGATQLTPDEQVAAVRTSVIVSVMFLAALCGLFAWQANRLRRGSAGAHLILIAGSVYLIVGAAFTLFGTSPAPLPESAPGWLHVTAGALTIVSAVTAGTGLVLSQTAQSREFLRGGGHGPHRGDRVDGKDDREDGRR